MNPIHSVLFLLLSLLPAFLFADGFTEHELDQFRNHELLRAVRAGHHDKMRELLAEGANPNFEERSTAFMSSRYSPIILLAISNKDAEAFHILKDAGASTEAKHRFVMLLTSRHESIFETLVRTADVAFIQELLPHIVYSKGDFADGLVTSSHFESPAVFLFLLSIAEEVLLLGGLLPDGLYGLGDLVHFPSAFDADGPCVVMVL